MEKSCFYVEAIDNGVIITEFGREQNYENPTGATVSFKCNCLENSLDMARFILGGRQEVREWPVDAIVEVTEISYLNKYREPEDALD